MWLVRRRPVILRFIFAAALFSEPALINPATQAIAVMLFLYTFVANFRFNASWISAAEVDGATPALASAASAMIYGVGFIGAPDAAPMFGPGEGGSG